MASGPKPRCDPRAHEHECPGGNRASAEKGLPERLPRDADPAVESPAELVDFWKPGDALSLLGRWG